MSQQRHHQSGRIEARTGLRMMPTFPRSPLSFRTAGFPQYGWKAGLSGGAFPDRQRLKPAPGMRLLTAGLPSPFVHLRVGAVVPYCAGPPTGRCTALEGGSPSAPGALARVRVMLSRSVLAEPAPSAPLAGTSRLHRRAAYTRCLRCAGAPRRPASGSGLSLPFRPDMPSSLTPGSSSSHVSSCATPTRPSPRSERLGTPNTPAIRSTRGSSFEASLVRVCYGLSGCSPPWTDRTRFPWPTGDFYIQASGGSVPLPAAGYDYNSNWTPLLAGLSPAGMAASLAAPDLIERNLGLGLEGDRLGHTGLLAPGWIINPLLRQVEAIGDRQAGRAIGKRERHGHLAIVLLAELAAILARHPDRVPALLGEAGIVDDPGLDGPSTLDGRQDQVAHRGEPGRIRPRRLTNEMQQRLVLGGNPGRGRDRGHRLYALAPGRHEQTRAVVAQGCGAVGVADDSDQRPNIGGKPPFTARMGSHRRASCAGQGPPSIPPDRRP